MSADEKRCWRRFDDGASLGGESLSRQDDFGGQTRVTAIYGSLSARLVCVENKLT